MGVAAISAALPSLAKPWLANASVPLPLYVRKANFCCEDDVESGTELSGSSGGSAK